MKIKLSELKKLISKALTEAPSRTSPSQLMKQITQALGSVGYKVTGRERNAGSLKAWLDLPKQKSTASSLSSEERARRDAMNDDEYYEYMAGVKAAAPQKNLVSSPSVLADLLNTVGLNVKTYGDNYETTLSGTGFIVTIPSESERQDIGSDIFVQIYTSGKYADMERSGVDTTDLSYNESVIYESPFDDTEDNLRKVISDMKPDQLATDDYVDVNSGEVVLGAGEPARKSPLHPQYTSDRNERETARKAKRDAELAILDKEDEEYEEEKLTTAQKNRHDFNSELNKFLVGFEGWALDNQNNTSDDVHDLASGAAHDIAQDFLRSYPIAMHVARDEGMTKQNMLSMIAELIYEKMISKKETNEAEINEVTPPGEEKLVRSLKKKGVKNPWALAWSIHNKKKK